MLHVTCAAQLSKRDLAARPTRYAHGQRPQATFATRTMRWGGVIIALFLVWHILDLTAGVTNPHFDKGSRTTTSSRTSRSGGSTSSTSSG